jgi:hypothetical protein
MGVSFKIPSRGTHDCNFFGRQDALAKGILAIALTKQVPFFDSKTYTEAEGISMENWSKPVRL